MNLIQLIHQLIKQLYLTKNTKGYTLRENLDDGFEAPVKRRRWLGPAAAVLIFAGVAASCWGDFRGQPGRQIAVEEQEEPSGINPEAAEKLREIDRAVLQLLDDADTLIEQHGEDGVLSWKSGRNNSLNRRVITEDALDGRGDVLLISSLTDREDELMHTSGYASWLKISLQDEEWVQTWILMDFENEGSHISLTDTTPIEDISDLNYIRRVFDDYRASVSMTAEDLIERYEN